jgi:hypothetical protein
MLKESGIEFLEVPQTQSQAAAHLVQAARPVAVPCRFARALACSVRVPLPERFAVHKLVVSRIRSGREAKSNKDVLQACVLMAALAERHPGAIESAVAQLPRKARKHISATTEIASRQLADHPRR